MKTILTAAAVLVMAVSAAQAKCGTKQLDGVWHLSGGVPGPFAIVVTNGTWVTAPAGGSGTITQKKDCSVTLVAGEDYLTGYSDMVAAKNPRKPRVIHVSGLATTIFTLLKKEQ